MISFFVPGEPKPQGSKRAFFNPKIGRAIMIEANAGQKPWRDSVIAYAKGAVPPTHAPLRVPVVVAVTFYFARPASHLRKDGTVKPAAPTRPGRYDLDKLLRNLGDALEQSGVLANDTHIAVWEAAKDFSTTGPGMRVHIRPIDERTDIP